VAVTVRDRRLAFFDAEASRLTRLYRDAQSAIVTALDRARIRGNDTAHLQAAAQEVAHVLSDLSQGAHTWTSEAIGGSYVMGVERVNEALAAAGIHRATDFAGLHTQAAQVLADNTYGRLAGVSDIVGRRVDDYYRALALENIRGAALGYENTRDAQQAAFSAFMERNDRTGVTGFVDSAGREWSMDVYAEMVGRTTLAETMRTGSSLRMQEAGIESFIFVGGEGSNTCAECEDMMAGGPYTQAEVDAYDFHPNCTHEFVADPAALDALQQEADPRTSA
jgi:hypothetical protein